MKRRRKGGGRVERKEDVFIEGNRVSEVAVVGRFQKRSNAPRGGRWLVQPYKLHVAGFYWGRPVDAIVDYVVQLMFLPTSS